jgi:hypothetical protein
MKVEAVENPCHSCENDYPCCEAHCGKLDIYKMLESGPNPGGEGGK